VIETPVKVFWKTKTVFGENYFPRICQKTTVSYEKPFRVFEKNLYGF
jgi:hypothetical protein